MMGQRLTLLCLAGIVVFFSSCANYRMHVAPSLQSNDFPPSPPPEEPEYTMYLVGDAGYAEPDSISPALAALKIHLQEAPPKSAVMFLGDNIYPNGLPPRQDPDRAESERRLRLQLDILKDFPGDPFFIPGNHDWRRHTAGVQREESYIEEYLNRGNVWRPDSACGDPDVLEINKHLVVVFVDSHWWLANWDKEPDINAGCEVKSRKNFLIAFDEIIKKHRQKNIVIALHHPPYTNGPHGGRYTFKQHLFPLTDINHKLYVPLPGIGSLFAFLRGTIGSTQDAANPIYKSLMKGLLDSAQKNGQFIFVSGHEHNLQYFENDQQAFIVSGSGSKTSPASLGRGAQFAYGARGFSILKFYRDGSSYVEFWVGDHSSPRGKMVFAKQVKGPLPAAVDFQSIHLPSPDASHPNQQIVIDPKAHKSGLHRFVLGEHYRSVYHTPIEVPVLHLESAYGGLTPIKRGGGYQTNSLRLQAADGKQYVMRAILKDAARLVPYPFNQTIAKDLFADQLSAVHPFSALAIPGMARAAGIYHTNPKIFFVPKQSALGLFNDDFGGELYLFEERPSGDWSETASFGYAKSIIDSPEMVKKTTKNYRYRIDVPFTVRSRLFDMLIGDWDRHDDQWRWAEFESDSSHFTFLRPIPRDRDQAFHKYDGLVTALLRGSTPFLRQLRVFKPHVKSPKWINYNARNFDQSFLTEADWSVWKREALALQKNITDQLIAESMAGMPAPAFELTGKDLIAKVIGRREKLLDIARQHYLLLARKVDIVGTEQQDYFEVTRLDPKRTLVRVYHAQPDGAPGELYYERTFLSDETKEIRLYALEGEDFITLGGKTPSALLIRVIGGLDQDTYRDSSAVAGLGKKNRIYDFKNEDNRYFLGKESKLRKSTDPILNGYDRKAPDYEYNHLITYPSLGFNPDDGLMLGLGFKSIRYGFKKSPYAAVHNLGAQYAFATSGFGLKYKGEFIRAVGKNDLLIKSKVQGPLFTVNYFGMGNKTTIISNDNEDFDYNRVRQSLYGLYPALRRPVGGSGALSLILGLEATKIEKTTDRFVSSPESMIPEEVFRNNYFGSGELRFDLKNVNQSNFPTLGVDFSASLAWTTNLAQLERQFTTLAAHLSVFLGSEKLVFASRIGGKRVNGDFLFFQAATLGGTENLRGFRDERFTGGAAFYHNTDLRLRLIKADTYYLPFSMGILGGYDYGRVWLQGERSAQWHQSYGGGIWINPFDAATINLSLFKSRDGARFTLGGKFLF